jgi:hypothetical protein
VNACRIIARPKTYKFYLVLFLMMTVETYAVFDIGSKRFDAVVPPRHFTANR